MDENKVYVAVSIVSLFFVAAGFGVLPNFIQHNAKALCLINCLAGGVFLSTSINHLLPEAVEELGHESENLYQNPYFLCGAGFLVLLTVEQIAHLLTDNLQLPSHTHSNGSSPQNASTEKTSSNNVDSATGTPKECVAYHPGPSSSNQIKCAQDEIWQTKSGFAGQSIEEGHQHVCTSHDEDRDSHCHNPSAHIHISSSSPTAVVVAFLLALTIHAIFDGLVLGAQTEGGQWDIFVAVIAHKGLEAFALGATLVRAQWKKQSLFAVMIGFALVSPLGVLLGVWTTSTDPTATGMVNALAAGTFLFVAVVEIIATELRHDDLTRSIKMELSKVTLLIVGFVLTSILNDICHQGHHHHGHESGHEHDHDHDHHHHHF